MLTALRHLDFLLVQKGVAWTSSSSLHQLLVYLGADVLLLLFPLILLYLWQNPEGRTRKHGNQKAVIIALVSVVAALAIKEVISLLWLRDRPFVTHPELSYLALRVDPASFPSGHTLVAFAIASSIYFSGYRRFGFWMLIGATIVAICRVMAGVHYPSDVIAGALIGVVTSWVLHHESSALRRYLPN